MRHDQRTDEEMRLHTEDLATAAGRNQPTDRDERWDQPEHPDIPETRAEDEARAGEPGEPMARPTEEPADRPAEEELDARSDEPEIRPDEAEVRPDEPMARSAGEEILQLFRPEDVQRFRAEWQQVQVRFVDDPRDAVESADHLVAEVMQSLATTFNEHKQELEGQWRQDSGVQTEELRLALRRYRSFFNQLLNA